VEEKAAARKRNVYDGKKLDTPETAQVQEDRQYSAGNKFREFAGPSDDHISPSEVD
jgi:hypothetical protein